ncbi:MAG: class I SAM-dependent RNA methyltransferase [Gemmatimonadaceae bacterium]
MRDTRQYTAFAVTAPGVAPFAARELEALGLSPNEPEAGGVAFSADARGLYVANLQLRTANRVLVRVDEFRASNFHELERRTARLPWNEWIAPGREVALRVTCRKSRLYHSGAVSERVAAALAGVTGQGGVSGAPRDDDADGDGEAQLVVVRLLNDRCTISLDASGALLHQRGYRLAVGKAPLRETLGAALLLAAPWDPSLPLVDPFCGSGTLAIEGAMIARRLAPGRHRRFAFEQWPAFDPELWHGVRGDAARRELPTAPSPIVASDRDAGAIDAAEANAQRAGVAGDITFVRHAVSSAAPPEGVPGPGWVITNPPYGQRVGITGELRDLYARFGAVLRERFPGWHVGVLSTERRLTAQLGTTLTPALLTSNGGLPVTLAVGTVASASAAPRGAGK